MLMRSLLRRLLVMLVALAFIVGGVGGFAAPVVVAAERCTQEHTDTHHHSGKTPANPAHKKPPRLSGNNRRTHDCR